jgi:hypothetical protein
MAREGDLVNLSLTLMMERVEAAGSSKGRRRLYIVLQDF